MGSMKNLFFRSFTVLSVLTTASVWAQDLKLEKEAKRILAQKCLACHSDGGSAGFVLGNILDNKNLFKHKAIIPKKGATSTLVKSMKNGSMPKGGAPMTAAEINVITKWIDSFPADAGKPKPCVDEQTLANQIKDDIKTLSADEARNTRYISVANLEDPTAAIRGINKVLNSLSDQPEIYNPPLVNGNLLRIDLRKIGWNASTWDLIESKNPQQNKRAENFNAQEFSAAFGTRTPMMSGDLLAATALKSSTYQKILKMPSNVKTLEAKLGINVAQNIRDRKVARSGFRDSGVSANNRIIERHETKFGSYWKSYDFQKNLGKENIFAHPDDFVAAGGEIIYHLPNGMQAYLLVDGDGNVIDKAPSSIVQDNKRPDHAVENGVSCFRCHSGGMLKKDDQIRDTIDANKLLNPDKVADLKKLYTDPSDFNELIDKDNDLHHKAITAAGGEPDLDDVTKLVQEFEQDIGIDRAACELSVSVDEMKDIIKSVDGLGSIVPLTIDCNIPRETFIDSFKLLSDNLSFAAVKESDGFKQGEVVLVGGKPVVISKISADGKFHIKEADGKVKVASKFQLVKSAAAASNGIALDQTVTAVVNGKVGIFKVAHTDGANGVHIQPVAGGDIVKADAASLKAVTDIAKGKGSFISLADPSQKFNAVKTDGEVLFDDKGNSIASGDAGAVVGQSGAFKAGGLASSKEGIDGKIEVIFKDKDGEKMLVKRSNGSKVVIPVAGSKVVAALAAAKPAVKPAVQPAVKDATPVVVQPTVVAPVSNVFKTSKGTVKFKSETAINTVESSNSTVSGSFDFDSGDVSVTVPMKNFKFSQELMKEHFNSEDFLDTGRFPNAQFTGKITNLAAIDVKKPGVQKVTVEGQMSIHGKTKTLKFEGTVELKNGVLVGKSSIKLDLKQFGVDIPFLQETMVSEKVTADLNLNLGK